MIKRICLGFFLVMNVLNAQQLLWTTDKRYSSSVITNDAVFDEVMKFYDFYEMYFDGTGYTKTEFASMLRSNWIFSGSNVANISKLELHLPQIKSPTYFAYKGNTGNGAIIYILCMDNESLDVIAFSNIPKSSPNLTSETNRDKFMNWFLSVSKLSNKKTKRVDPPNLPSDDDIFGEGGPIVMQHESLNDNSDNSPVADVQVKASFPGGEAAFREYVYSTFQYPVRCKDQGIKGSVVLRFVVDQSGRVSKVSAIQETKSCPEFTEEAIRVLKISPRWIPGQNRGKFVISWREIPISIPLND